MHCDGATTGAGDSANRRSASNAAYGEFDAERRFGLSPSPAVADSVCIAGLVLQGVKRPHECPAFGTACTPEHPLGAPMVSSEGACAAYYQHRRRSHG